MDREKIFAVLPYVLLLFASSTIFRLVKRAVVMKNFMLKVLSRVLHTFFSMNFEKYISFTSTYKITKQKRELLPKHEQESAPKFPNIMVCNYQAHSRLLLKQNYPMMTMRRTLDLYKVEILEFSTIDGSFP